LSDRDGSQHLPLEAAILRNSYFGRADALFDMGKYEDAIQAYSAATNRYQHEPESLEAYVQIASCYRRLGRTSEARRTLEQARVVLQRIRPDADFAKTTRLARNDWGQLLDWLRTL
jgi:TolA-binding protein